MCGRYSFSLKKETFKKQVPFELPDLLKISYNIAPTQPAYVITANLNKKLQEMRWGLIPSWKKTEKPTIPLINARLETILEKPSFKNSFQSKRCIVPADSFYEWNRDSKNKIPYRIAPKNKDLFFFAGIYDIWTNGKDIIESFSILTQANNEDLKYIHHRMPIIFENFEEAHQYLSSNSTDAVMQSLKPFPNGKLDIYKVSPAVNKVVNNSASLHRRIPDELTLF